MDHSVKPSNSLIKLSKCCMGDHEPWSRTIRPVIDSLFLWQLKEYFLPWYCTILRTLPILYALEIWVTPWYHCPRWRFLCSKVLTRGLWSGGLISISWFMVIWIDRRSKLLLSSWGKYRISVLEVAGARSVRWGTLSMSQGRWSEGLYQGVQQIGARWDCPRISKIVWTF